MAQVYCERVSKINIFFALLLSTLLPAVALLADKPFDIAHVTDPPVLLDKAEPRYPAEARSNGVGSATVRMSIVITTEGRVTQVRVLKPVSLGFDEAARHAVMRWRFRPLE